MFWNKQYEVKPDVAPKKELPRTAEEMRVVSHRNHKISVDDIFTKVMEGVRKKANKGKFEYVESVRTSPFTSSTNDWLLYPDDYVVEEAIEKIRALGYNVEFLPSNWRQKLSKEKKKDFCAYDKETLIRQITVSW